MKNTFSPCGDSPECEGCENNKPMEETMAKSTKSKIKKVEETISIAIGEDGPFVEYSGKRTSIEIVKILATVSARLVGMKKLSEGERELVLAYQKERAKLMDKSDG